MPDGAKGSGFTKRESRRVTSQELTTPHAPSGRPGVPSMRSTRANLSPGTALKAPSPPKKSAKPIVFNPTCPLLTTPDAQLQKQVVVEQQKRIEELNEESSQRQVALESANRSNCQVAEYFETCVIERDEEIRELRQSIVEKTNVFDESLASLRKEMQDQLLAAKGEANTMELSLRRQVAELKEDNKQLLHFRKQQKDLETQLSQKKEELCAMASELELCELEWHRRLARVSSSLEEQYKTQLENATQEFNARAHKEVASTITMHETKISRYKLNLEEFQLSKKAWDKDRASMKAEVTRWKTDAALYKKQCMEMTKQLTTAKKHNAELYHACKALKKRVEVLMKGLTEKESEDLELVCIPDAQPANAFRTPRVHASEATKVLEKKLRELKSWARRLVDLRSEEETFLLDAIADAKAKRSEIALLGTDDSAQSEQPLSESGAGAADEPARNPAATRGVQIDEDGRKQLQIEDATWRQREEILKMVFRKINERAAEVQTAKNQISLRTHL
eukprot:GEMP01019801.1.p1 GENE.GEMP01019801.1~~GEMP01019801.1.p1  ORF type:complete len:508 (+),score=131.04 GEMP01019801.1:146-1669(+)